MSEEIVFRPSSYPRPGPTKNVGNGVTEGYIRPEHRNGPYDNPNGRGRLRLNPTANPFFSTYPMSDSLPTLTPPPEAFKPPTTRPIRVRQDPDRKPPGPIPTQVRSGYDRPPHHSPAPTSSNALVIREPSSRPHAHTDDQRNREGHGRSQYRYGGEPNQPDQNQAQFRPSPNHHTQETHSPSTTFHIGPLPPIFTIDQIHMAMRSLNPKVALLDIKLGLLEIEIPYTLTWQQIGDWCRRGIKIGELTIPVKSGVSTDQQRPWS